jgi:hypothetical protein
MPATRASLFMVTPKVSESTEIPQIPGLLSVIFRLIEARCNEIRSQLHLFEAKSPGCPPTSEPDAAQHSREGRADGTPPPPSCPAGYA